MFIAQAIAMLFRWVILCALCAACSAGSRDVGYLTSAALQENPAEPVQEHADHVIQTIFVASSIHENNGQVAPVKSQLEELAATEGFDIRAIGGLGDEIYVRDMGVATNDGRLLVSPTTQPALYYARADVNLLLPEADGSIGRFAAVPTHRLDEIYTLAATGRSLTRTEVPVYLEGGDVMTTTCGGRTKVFVGENTVRMTAALRHHLKLPLLRTNFAKPLKQRMSKEILVGQRSRNLALLAGLDTDTAIFHPSSQFTTSQLNASLPDYFAKSMVQGDPSRAADKMKLANAITTWSQRIEDAKQALANAFSISRNQLVVLESVFYHLDVFMSPGPPGVVLMQSPEADVGLNAHGSLLASNVGAEWLAKSGGLVNAALYENASRVHRAGCKVSAIDALIFPDPDYEAIKGPIVNFFNGLMGTGPLSGGRFYITNAIYPRLPNDGAEESYQAFSDILLNEFDTQVHYMTHQWGITDCAGTHCFLATQ